MKRVRTSALPRPALAAGLAALALAVYLPVIGFGFLNYDDPGYVTANPRIQDGLSLGNTVWAFGAFQNGNWHPVTLLSHMADVSAFGLDPRGHHATSLALHLVNVLLLFLLLSRATGRDGPSAFVAAAFAVHPLNVQTVAWIAERKSLLSTLFWLVTLLAWIAFRRTGAKRAYTVALAAAALALASKPMAVTIPFTLLLLDAWPLGVVRRRFLPVAPFVALSLGCGLATLAAQRGASALQTLDAYPLAVRLTSVPVGYAWYLVKAVWPSGLAVFYPHPHVTASAGVAVACAVVLAGITAAAVLLRRSRPHLGFGWWWYAITLAPVSGIVQVGSQAYADRYAYVPLVGIFAIAAWTAAHAFDGAAAWHRWARGALAVASIAALAVACRTTLASWRDSEALFRRAVEVVPDGSVAHNNLGLALVDRGRVAEAVEHFRSAVEHAPWDLRARSNLGSALTVLGRPSEAVPVFEDALAEAPDDPSLRFNLAKALVGMGRTPDAIAQLEEAMRVDPSYPKAPLFLGGLLLEARRLDDAIPVLEKAVALAPRDPQAPFTLGVALAAVGRKAEALRRVEEALRLDPRDPRAQALAARLRSDPALR